MRTQPLRIRRLIPSSILAAVFAWQCVGVVEAASRVAHYRLDEPAGASTVIDSAGSNHSVALPGDPTFGVPGTYFTTAGDFDGAGDGVNLGSGSALKPTDDFTVTFWFNPNDLSTFNFDRIIDATGGGGPIDAGWRVLLVDSSGDRKVRWLTYDGGAKQTINPVVLAEDTWFFGAATYSTTDGAQTLTINQTVASSSVSSPIDYTNQPAAEVYLARSAGGNEFNTGLDDVALWDSVLTSNEIQYVRTHGPAEIPLAHWTADDAPVAGQWLPRVGSDVAWNLDAAPDHVLVSSDATRIRKAYQFDGNESIGFTETGGGNSFANAFNATADASFEIWFRLGDSADAGDDVLDEGKRVLWETGGVNGSSLTVNDNLLRFGSASTSGPSGEEVSISFDLSTFDSTTLGDFMQAVGVYDDANGELRLYVNGVLVPGDPANPSTSITANWSGGNGAHLGSSAGDAVGGFYPEDSSFNALIGDIAVFSFYQQALTAQQVVDAYNALLVPEPAAAALFAAAGLLLFGRRPGSRRHQSHKE